MSYRVQLSLPAKKQLDRLDQVTARRLDDRLKELTFDPYSTRISKAIKMEPGQRTSRVGDWRIIYRVERNKPGDHGYGLSPSGKSVSIGHLKFKGLKPLVRLQLLHTWRLGITHPRTGEQMTLEVHCRRIFRRWYFLKTLI